MDEQELVNLVETLQDLRNDLSYWRKRTEMGSSDRDVCDSAIWKMNALIAGVLIVQLDKESNG